MLLMLFIQPYISHRNSWLFAPVIGESHFMGKLSEKRESE